MKIWERSIYFIVYIYMKICLNVLFFPSIYIVFCKVWISRDFFSYHPWDLTKGKITWEKEKAFMFLSKEKSVNRRKELKTPSAKAYLS
jgi:hypothetical protein